MPTYLEYTFPCNPDDQEMMIAELAESGFESFTQEEDHFLAYITDDVTQPDEIRRIIDKYGIDEQKVSSKEMEKVNWNEEWEKNFEPILIGNDCYVRADFHPSKPGIKFEIVIQPKMSFGTGHHSTTQLMIELMLPLLLYHKAVLDMGTGTGVLAVLAAKMGAGPVIAIDNDEWSFENAKENVERNGVSQVKTFLGNENDLNGLAELRHLKFDFILSNITKNANMLNFEIYDESMIEGGTLICSGFYETDLEDLKKTAALHNFKYKNHVTRLNWCAAVFSH